MFVTGIGLSGSRPVKTQVVLEQMLAQQVLFHVQDLGKIVSLHLDIGFTHLLPGGRNMRPLLQ